MQWWPGFYAVDLFVAHTRLKATCNSTTGSHCAAMISATGLGIELQVKDPKVNDKFPSGDGT